MISVLSHFNSFYSGPVLRHLHRGALTPAVTVVETELLLVEVVLPLLAADVVTIRLAEMRDVTEIMIVATETVIVIASASANEIDLAALTNVIVTETSKKIVTDMRTASVVMMSATLLRTAKTGKVGLPLIYEVVELCFELKC